MGICLIYRSWFTICIDHMYSCNVYICIKIGNIWCLSIFIWYCVFLSYCIFYAFSCNNKESPHWFVLITRKEVASLAWNKSWTKDNFYYTNNVKAKTCWPKKCANLCLLNQKYILVFNKKQYLFSHNFHISNKCCGGLVCYQKGYFVLHLPRFNVIASKPWVDYWWLFFINHAKRQPCSFVLCCNLWMCAIFL